MMKEVTYTIKGDKVVLNRQGTYFALTLEEFEQLIAIQYKIKVELNK